MTARSDDPGVSPGTSAAAAGGEIWSSASCASPSSAARSSDTTSRSGKAREEGKINSLDNNEKTPKCV